MGNIVRVFKTSAMISEIPVVTVLGCTGTGKSKLAIELAKRFNGEIISADSMQVYKGLDIITNKVTPEEQKEAVHHCINCIEPLSRYTVVDFRNQALPIINNIMKQNKLPIIVGGTNYYIESLLWEVLISNQKEHNKLLFDDDSCIENDSLTIPSNVSLSTQDLFKQKITADSFEDISNMDLHKSLQEIDPDMANSVHPEDRRKVIRSLQVYQQHGRRHSELLQEQRSQYGGSSLGGPLRFKNTVMLWLQCDKEVLNQRLDDRVDEMLERGLISELLNFHKDYNEKRIDIQNPRYSEGIFQSIGFKEFHEYLILSEEEKNSDTGQRILEKAIEEMKLVTRQYARKQTKWIINRFLKKPDRQLPPVYGLSATDLCKWNENALQPAIDIVQSFIEDKEPSQKPLPVEEGLNDIKETYYCDVCERLILGQNVWKIHLSSKRHQKRKAKLQKVSKKSNTQECANIS
ncbi:tRNA dimethylallyltransferase-like [Argiope bruennichi]|uniref:tRNA dimethylallyltransferase-like n=1 Tax=Argiope bruennichi TaxID=94029 RepID=UPI0024945929|nr:tRNA dimethylallyltransferase-like [Argiope bruennichi]